MLLEMFHYIENINNNGINDSNTQSGEYSNIINTI